MRAFYFGCVGGSGHFFHNTRLRSVGLSAPELGLPWEYVDGKLNPPEEHHGEALLHHKDGWTALAFADRTVDTRGGSNSVFFFDQELDFDAALQAAEVNFPKIMERLAAADVEIVNAVGRPTRAQRRWRVLAQSKNTILLGHPLYEHRLAVLLSDDQTIGSVEATYPCSVCRWAKSCGDPPGEDCHS